MMPDALCHHRVTLSWHTSHLFHSPPKLSRVRYPCITALARSGTLYDRLEISPNVGISDIKQAYRQLARRYHPDVCPSHLAEESTRRFIEIQEAYETLSDPRRRAVYDHAVAMGRESAATGRMPWMADEKDLQPTEWKTQWESQLSELKWRKPRNPNSWSARVRTANGINNS